MITTKAPAQKRLEQQKKGFTLTEIAIVLGIMGLVLGAIWVAASGVYNNQRVNTAATTVMQTVQGIRSLYATSSTTGVGQVNITTQLINAGALPSNIVSGATTAGPFPGGFTAVASNGDAGGGNGFVISMSGATRAACINLLTQIGGTGRDPGLYRAAAKTPSVLTAATAITDNVDTVAATPAALTVPVTPALASAAEGANRIGGCIGAAPAATYTVIFGFTLK